MSPAAIENDQARHGIEPASPNLTIACDLSGKIIIILEYKEDFQDSLSLETFKTFQVELESKLTAAYEQVRARFLELLNERLVVAHEKSSPSVGSEDVPFPDEDEAGALREIGKTLPSRAEFDRIRKRHPVPQSYHDEPGWDDAPGP